MTTIILLSLVIYLLGIPVALVFIRTLNRECLSEFHPAFALLSWCFPALLVIAITLIIIVESVAYAIRKITNL